MDLPETNNPVKLLEESIKSEERGFEVTGLMVRSYHICKRELYYIFHQIEPERSRSKISRGSRVDDEFYTGYDSAIIDGLIQVDLIDDDTLVEVKATSSVEKPSILQLGYYMWYLERFHDLEFSGELAYPTERERNPVEFDDELRAEVKETIRGIYEVVSSETIPEFEKKPFCSTCAFQSICWMGGKE